MPLPVLLALAAAQATAPAQDRAVARMVALYDEVCLRAFPVDAAVDVAMAKHGATALTPEQVKVTLVDDPGRGWQVADPDGRPVFVFLEQPPFHACSVRRGTNSGFIDPAAYRAVADAYQRDHAGFVAIPPYDSDTGAIHIHAVGEQRVLPGGGADVLFVIEQHITDPARRAKGETGVELRFVHQQAAGR